MRVRLLLSVLVTTWSLTVVLFSACQSAEIRADTQRLTSSIVFITADSRLKGTDQRKKVTGSGVIVSSDGFVLTAAHVIPDLADPSSYEDVHLSATVGHNFGTPIPLEQTHLVNADLDVVYLKLPVGVVFSPAVVENDPILIGSEVVSLSFPYGLDVNALSGAISSLNGPGATWLTDIKIHEGSSGGPVFDSNGRLIGILSGGFQFGLNPQPLDLNLIIPIALARSVAGGVGWRVQDDSGGSQLKICRDLSNGVDHYQREFDVSRASGEMGGGHSQDEWCNTLIASQKIDHPLGVFAIVAKQESSRSGCSPFNCPLYTYSCTVHVRTDPVYVEKASPACH